MEGIKKILIGPVTLLNLLFLRAIGKGKRGAGAMKACDPSPKELFYPIHERQKIF
jgi:hypothetical protein